MAHAAKESLVVALESASSDLVIHVESFARHTREIEEQIALVRGTPSETARSTVRAALHRIMNHTARLLADTDAFAQKLSEVERLVEDLQHAALSDPPADTPQ